MLSFEVINGSEDSELKNKLDSHGIPQVDIGLASVMEQLQLLPVGSSVI